MMTINISLPKTMYEDAKKAMTTKRYASVSEFIRDALRDVLYPRVSINGFTPEFEDLVLKASKSPKKHDRVWDGKGSFTDFAMNRSQKKYDKD